ncbi:MAG: hypothetical protein H7256_01710 [Bdellovibrio sp.]|nr:hypothetical protein [Bdellovibrio sp.]
MLLRNFSSSLLASATFAVAVLSSGHVSAQYALQGSGYWGGTQGCSTQQRVGNGAISISEEEKEEKRQLEKQNAQIKLFERDVEKNEAYLKRISKNLNAFFSDDVAEFITETHIQGTMLCEDYKTYPGYNCPVKKTSKELAKEDADRKARIAKGEADPEGTPVETPEICKNKTSVPKILASNWTSGAGYCQAEDKRSRGQVSMEICDDESLRAEVDKKARKVSVAECKSSLKDYRTRSIQLENARAQLEKAKQDLQDREERIADEKERAAIEKKYSSTKTEAQAPCADCEAQASNQNKSYGLSIAQIGAGVLFGAIGKKYDDRNAQYQAQLGYPPESGSPTAVSFGFPYLLAGAYGALTGGSATGSYACGNGVNGTGAANGNLWGGGNSVYGPAGNAGGAFGYPQNMYANPWGGGAYNPGLNAYGNFNGPNGGLSGNLNGQFGVGSPLNGLLGAAGNGLLNGGVGTAFNNGLNGALNGQFGAAAGAGYPTAGYNPMYAAANGTFANGQFGVAANGSYANGSYANGSYANGSYANGAYGLQQQQAQLQYQAQLAAQQAQQAQAQYYQAQIQAQQQQQRQIMVQQQAGQLTAQIQQVQQNSQYQLQILQQNLNSLLSSANYGSSGYSGLGAGGYGGVGVSAGFNLGLGVNTGYSNLPYNTGTNGIGTAFNNYNLNYNNTNTGTSATVPGIGTGVRIGR